MHEFPAVVHITSIRFLSCWTNPLLALKATFLWSSKSCRMIDLPRTRAVFAGHTAIAGLPSVR
jgi:hypothetical protein